MLSFGLIKRTLTHCQITKYWIKSCRFILIKMVAGQQRWLQIALDHADPLIGPVPTRRLRKSIIVGRLLTPKEMMIDPADRGRLNHIPFLNRLNAWWWQMKEDGWLKRATREQKEILVRDLNLVTRIIKELQA